MIIYKVYESYFSCGEYFGHTKVRYYISKKLAEDDLNQRRKKHPRHPSESELFHIEEFSTED